MKREQICKQQIHCLGCKLSVSKTKRDCRTLNDVEVKRIMEDRCICCGDIIPEGRQICYRCERSK